MKKNSVIGNLRFRAIVLKRSITHSFLGTFSWAFKGANLPAPNYVKLKLLKRNFIAKGICIETGTYLGETTLSLSKNFPKVISIEPAIALHQFARNRFKNIPNVELILGTSEEMLAKVIHDIPDKSTLNFWLDGHFSGGFTYSGDVGMPLQEELEAIQSNLERLKEVVIAIDDFRTIGNSTKERISRAFLVAFAQKNSLFWSVEHDVFFMEKRAY